MANIYNPAEDQEPPILPVGNVSTVFSGLLYAVHKAVDDIPRGP